ncbi:MAG TPA: hypothetical protein VEY51_11525 [Chondromyces sp.]|nr:hypothetical protein [Chondromyces sp.]
MKQFQILLALSLTIACFGSIYLKFEERTAEETIIFFPLNESAHFTSAETSLEVESLEKNKEWKVQWRTKSTLNQKAYLRQDLSLLFRNGRLKQKMSKWEQNTDSVSLKNTVSGSDNSLLQSVTFHYAEIHNGDDSITSAQSMSKEQLYLIISSHHPTATDGDSKTAEEKEWKRVMDKAGKEQIKSTTKQALKKYRLMPQNYHIIPLTELPMYTQKPFPGFTDRQTQRILGNLWEGLYKNYFLGVKKEDGTTASPIGSSIPLIFLPKTTKFIYIVIPLKDGELIKLQQMIP